MRSQDRTLLASLGFADPDKGNPLHTLACQYLAEKEQGGLLLSSLYKKPAALDLFTAQLEVPVSKGYGSYKSTIGWMDLFLRARWPDGSRGEAVVEVKIGHTDAAACLRQLNLYREYFTGNEALFVLVTHFDLSPIDDRTLQENGVLTVRLGSDFERWAATESLPKKHESKAFGPGWRDALPEEPAPPVPVHVSPAGAARVHAAPAEPPKDPDARKRRLAELATEVRVCQKCPLHTGRTQTVFARGNPSAELCFVGEGPGADEDARGEPFVGKAGQLLDNMISAMGLAREDVYVCNIVKCRPPGNRKPEFGEIVSCTPYLAEQLALVGPKVIVALGATAVEGLLGANGGITRLRGSWRLYRGMIPVMLTFHPSYLLRNPEAKGEVEQDLQAVLKQMGSEVA
jgi:DNA polymerase